MLFSFLVAFSFSSVDFYRIFSNFVAIARLYYRLCRATNAWPRIAIENTRATLFRRATPTSSDRRTTPSLC
jgi:hypothetical protein